MSVSVGVIPLTPQSLFLVKMLIMLQYVSLFKQCRSTHSASRLAKLGVTADVFHFAFQEMIETTQKSVKTKLQTFVKE